MLMFVVLGLVAAVSGQGYGSGGAVHGQGYGNGGAAPVLIRSAHPVASVHGRPTGYVDDYSEPIPYRFSYDVADDYNTKLNRQESSDGYGNVQGSYGYSDAYGNYRQVDYTADDYGYRAQIKTNEHGTANQNPADVSIDSDAAPVHYQAPQRQQHAPAHQQRAVSYAPAHQQRAVSYAPAHQQRAASYGPAHQQRAVSYAPAHQQRAVSYAPAHQQRAASYGPGPVHQQRSVSYAPAKRVVSYAPTENLRIAPSYRAVHRAVVVDNKPSYGRHRVY